MNWIGGLKAVGLMVFVFSMMYFSIMGLLGQLPNWTLIIPIGFFIGLVFYSGARK